jgi:ABC-type multidrug transport system fused ATPase/permease subunit
MDSPAQQRADRSAQGRAGLPPLWSGGRRAHLSLLILAGFAQAAAAGLSARLFSHALNPSEVSTRGLVLAVLVAAAAVVGLLRMTERVLAERLSQDYVHQIRLGLIRRNLADGKVKSLGIAVARTTNDLTSVKNWVSQGVAPLAVGIPLIIGVAVVLVLLDPLLSVGLLAPLGVLVLAMKALAPLAYARTRIVRRQRGRLSSQVADTLLSTVAIRSGGGSERELQRIDKYSQRLVAASIQRAKVAGAMRGAAASATGITTAMVIGIGLLAGLPTHSIAGAITLVAFLATPILDLGRVVEYRQTYLAARRIIGPAIEAATEPPSDSPTNRLEEGAAVRLAGPAGEVITTNLELSDATIMSDLRVQPGGRVIVDTGNERMTSEVLERFAGISEGFAGEVTVDGKDLALALDKELRASVGYAARGMMLMRGTLSRAIRYRCPDANPTDLDDLLAKVGLTRRVAGLTKGPDTILVHGGDPLTIPERARVLLARAVLGNPPLLVFDHLDADLGTEGRDVMRTLLHDYPGVVILASDDPFRVITPTHIWRPDNVRVIEHADRWSTPPQPPDPRLELSPHSSPR